MATSGLYGSFPLTQDGINQNVTATSPGAYALGRTRDGKFRIGRIGRSDSDVNDRLHDYIDQYSEFKFDYFNSARAAFEKECHLWHDFSPPDNAIHPDRPDGSSLKCPVPGCSVLD